VAVFKPGRDTSLARSRANHLIYLFVIHHLAVPVDRSSLIDVLGTNGGPVCARPNGALTRALQDEQASNGAATVGSRPVRIDREVVIGEQLVIQVYCPGKLAGFRTYVDGKKYYAVIRR